MLKGHIINELIDERRVKKVDLYTYAGITKSTLDNIIKGINDPKCTTIEKIADFFRVSTDYLLGREEKPVTGVRLVDVTGLTSTQISHIMALIDDLRN